MITDDSNLKLTGKATLLVDNEDYSPIVFHIDDLEAVHKLINIILSNAGPLTNVDSYDESESVTYKRIMRLDK